jgi:hypothetical protein
MQKGAWHLLQAMDPKKIMINGDQFGGLAKWPAQKTELEKMSARIDRLENAIKNSVPSTGSPDSGAALKTSMVVTLNAPLPKENFEDLENEIVNHG